VRVLGISWTRTGLQSPEPPEWGRLRVCGLLVRLPFIATFSQSSERWLAKYIPGYDAYKALAEEKLQKKVRILPYATALIKQHEYWQPVYVVEGR
jgi:hypothetical protein